MEVGGTVGDIESLPFLEAIRQMRKDVGRGNVLYVHVTLLPSLAATGELKTKPTQHSVKELRSIGIQPDVIVARSDLPVDEDLRDKIALFCDVSRDAVIPCATVDTIYEVPLLFESFGLGDLVVRELGLTESAAPADLTAWTALVERIKRPKPELEIALVGKYIELPDAYLSVTEALRHAGWAEERTISIRWVDSERLTADDVEASGSRAWRECWCRAASAIGASRARSSPPATRGSAACPTSACAWASSAGSSSSPGTSSGERDANSTEFDLFTDAPVIDLMPDQREVEDKGGSMRLGLYPARLTPGPEAEAAYGTEVIYERHRHRFEVNNQYREALESAGMLISGQSPDGRLVEIVELRDHPWFVASQFHPEFKSRPDRPHPLFRGFVRAAMSGAVAPAGSDHGCRRRGFGQAACPGRDGRAGALNRTARRAATFVAALLVAAASLHPGAVAATGAPHPTAAPAASGRTFHVDCNDGRDAANGRRPSTRMAVARARQPGTSATG